MTSRCATPTRPVPAGDAEVPIAELRVGPSLREEGLDAAHVDTLAELEGAWPPILVRRDDRSVVDGQHRVAAARRLGLRALQVEWFDGSAKDAFVEFVRCNVGHGLPLGLGERRSAAGRILLSHPERSDRSIASVCGVSPKTVARLRGDLAVTAPLEHPTRRVGRDGRARPVDPADLRARITEELERRPEASLRAIATVVGSSPETVRSVRAKLRSVGGRTEPAAERELDTEATVLGLLTRAGRAGHRLEGDCAFSGREHGVEFVTWFDATTVEAADVWTHVGTVPRSRIYEVADEARRRAGFWTHFADSLEGQVRRRA
jgi:ParB-like chromosome segregation protein Spo0J